MEQTNLPLTDKPAWSVYLGTALISFSMLALQVTLTRLLSVITWYYMAFAVISTAMLGMTAGAMMVYLRPKWFTKELLNKSIVIASLCCAFIIPLSLVILCLFPLMLAPFPLVMAFATFPVGIIACTLPYYCSGVAITAVLTKYPLPIGKLYASDLIGASLGCLFVLGGLEILDAPSLILLCGAISALAALSFEWGSQETRSRRIGWLTFALLLILSMSNSFTMYGIRPYVVKGAVEPSDQKLIERWNSFSQVVVYKETKTTPPYYGASPLAPTNYLVSQHGMTIDGVASTCLRRFTSLSDIEHLRYDVTNLVYYLRPNGGACIIGVGGGRDIQSALLFGHTRVVGIDVNPIFINLLQREFRDMAGVANHTGVKLYIDEARSFLSRTVGRYSVIQMSLVDTWAATGAGAFSLSENALYTVEAWQVFINRLSNDGILTISRWYDPTNLGETGRIVSLAVASLFRTGIQNPSRHIAMATAGKISTLLLSKRPFTDRDIAALKQVTSELRYSLVISPDELPHNAILGKIVSARSSQELQHAIMDEDLNYEPPTDENPYFFNMLRLKHIGSAFRTKQGVIQGNIQATSTLLAIIFLLLMFAYGTIFIPLQRETYFSEQDRRYVPAQFWAGALYFSLIGTGFMLVEIGLIQRLSIFLGHPIYALGILLFTIILSSGLGSYLSEHLPITRAPWVFICPVCASILIIAMSTVLTIVISGMITAPIFTKIIVSIVVIFPLGLIMGFFFPTGMRLVRQSVPNETPWFWALNGIFGLLSSALAVFFSIYFGISTNFYIAAACYAMLLGSLPILVHGTPRL